MAEAIQILYVDDDVESLSIRGDILAGYDDIDVVTASSVSEAMDRLDEFDIDCILSDLHMPETDGIEFFELVRDAGRDVPFVLFTADESTDSVSRAFEAGVSDFVPKSIVNISFDLLANRLRRIVENDRKTPVPPAKRASSDEAASVTLATLETEIAEEVVDSAVDEVTSVEDDGIASQSNETDSSDRDFEETDLFRFIGDETLDRFLWVNEPLPTHSWATDGDDDVDVGVDEDYGIIDAIDLPESIDDSPERRTRLAESDEHSPPNERDTVSPRVPFRATDHKYHEDSAWEDGKADGFPLDIADGEDETYPSLIDATPDDFVFAFRPTSAGTDSHGFDTISDDATTPSSVATADQFFWIGEDTASSVDDDRHGRLPGIPKRPAEQEVRQSLSRSAISVTQVKDAQSSVSVDDNITTHSDESQWSDDLVEALVFRPDTTKSDQSPESALAETAAETVTPKPSVADSGTPSSASSSTSASATPPSGNRMPLEESETAHVGTKPDTDSEPLGDVGIRTPDSDESDTDRGRSHQPETTGFTTSGEDDRGLPTAAEQIRDTDPRDVTDHARSVESPIRTDLDSSDDEVADSEASVEEESGAVVESTDSSIEVDRPDDGEQSAEASVDGEQSAVDATATRPQVDAERQDPTKSTESTELTESTESTEPTETTESTESTESAETSETTTEERPTAGETGEQSPTDNEPELSIADQAEAEASTDHPWSRVLRTVSSRFRSSDESSTDSAKRIKSTPGETETEAEQMSEDMVASAGTGPSPSNDVTVGSTPTSQSPGTSTLVKCRSHDTANRAVCDERIGIPGSADKNVVLIRYKHVSEDRLESLVRYASAVTVVSVGYSQSVPERLSESIETIHITNPDDLTRLGIVVTGVIGSWESRSEQSILCFDSLNVLIQYRSVQDVFRFLHVLLAKLQSSEAISHFHIDPVADDSQEVNSLEPLFDEVVTGTDSE